VPEMERCGKTLAATDLPYFWEKKGRLRKAIADVRAKLIWSKRRGKRGEKTILSCEPASSRPAEHHRTWKNVRKTRRDSLRCLEGLSQ